MAAFLMILLLFDATYVMGQLQMKQQQGSDPVQLSHVYSDPGLLTQVLQRLENLEAGFAKVNVIASKLDKLSADVDHLKAQAAINSVGFSATSTASEIFTLEAAATMSYPTITFQEGSGYDASTSVFTCPVNGIYYFQASFGSGLGKQQFLNGQGYPIYYYVQDGFLALTHDDATATAMRLFDYWEEDFFEAEDWQSHNNAVSNSAVFYCAAASRVQVKAVTASSLQCPAGTCVFSGFLIEQSQ